MTSTLQDKLKQYGFPEPDGIELEDSWSGHRVATYKLTNAVSYLIYQESRDFSLTSHCKTRSGSIVVTCLAAIKTDSDWQAVANFIKFLKAQND